VAEKLIVYFRLLTPNAAGAAEIAAFVRQKPRLAAPNFMERRRQEAIAAERDNATVPPSALRKTRRAARPRPALLLCPMRSPISAAGRKPGRSRASLGVAISDPATEAAFTRRFPGQISAADQWTRFQRLAWDDAAGAQRQMRLDSGQAPGLRADAYESQRHRTITHPEDDPGRSGPGARALRKLEQDQVAAAVWRASGTAAQKAAPEHLDAFWVERHLLSRKLLRAGGRQDAYDVIAAHGQSERRSWSRASPRGVHRLTAAQ